MHTLTRTTLATMAAFGLLAGLALDSGGVDGQGASARGNAVDAKDGGADVKVAKHVLRMPSLSPDGEWLAFVYDGDIWRVPTKGGTAQRLTSTLANDIRPIYSPDGNWLAFASVKHGGYDVYVMPATGGVSRRVTFHGAAEYPFGWSPDSTTVLYESSQRGTGQDMWAARVAGGEPWPISSGGFGQNEIQSAISPDGKRIAYVGNGRSTGHRQRGYSGSSSQDIWMCDFDGVTTTNHREVLATEMNECFPVFVDANTLGFVSFVEPNRGTGLTVPLFLTFDVTKGTNNEERYRSSSAHKFMDIREPSIAASAPIMAYTTGEREGWSLKVVNLKTGVISTPEIRIDTDTRTADMVVNTITESSEIAPSPDGKKVAFIAGNDVYVMAADEPGGVPRQVTDTVARERDVLWTSDSLGLIYGSARTGSWQLYHADLVARTERPLAVIDGGVVSPTLMPDGKSLVAVAEDKRLVQVPVDGGAAKTLLEGNFHGSQLWGRPYMLSPDGKWVVYTVVNARLHSQVHVAELATGVVSRISRLFESCRNVTFSLDGKRILFANSGEGDLDLYAVDLTISPLTFEEDKLADAITGKKAEPAPKPTNPPTTTINFDDIANRVRRVTSTTGNEGSPIGLDDGRTIVYFASEGRGSSQIMSTTFADGRAGNPRALTTTPTPKANIVIAPGGKDVWFRDGGVMQRMKTSGGPTTAFPFSVRQTRKVEDLRREAFRECVWTMKHYFYDADMHGVDWDAMAARYMQALEATPTGDEWGGLMNELLGELNSSHQGFTARDGRNDGFTESYGSLGLEFDPVALSRGEYKITKAYKGGPCDPTLVGNLEGQYLTGLNGVAFKAGETILARLLEGQIGKRVGMHINGTPAFEGSREVPVRGGSQGSEGNLQYDSWVNDQRAIVEKLSGGRIGYAHIRQMNQEAVRQFKRDLGSALEGKEAAVIDVRYNGGGNTAVDLLEILVKRPWVVRTDRSGESATENESRSVAMEIPSCLLINESSYSNAEMIAEGYKALGIGPVIGWPTGGAVIWTTSIGLLDGSNIRLPFAKVSTIDGENLENIGRQPDIKVANLREALEAGRDPQTETAVKTLLDMLGEKK